MGSHLSAERLSTMPQKAEVSCTAPTKATAPLDTGRDGQSVDTSNTAKDIAMEDVDSENSGWNPDATAGAKDTSPKDAPDTSEESNLEKKESTIHNLKCSECDLVKSATRRDKLRVCVGCKLAVHEKCYADALPLAANNEEQKKISTTEKRLKGTDSLDWKCDCCQRGVERRVAKCVYCGKAGGDTALKVVEKSEDDAFWHQCTKFEERKETEAAEFGHVLCINWDPRRLAAHIVKESKIKPAEKVPKKQLAKEEAEQERTKDAATATSAVNEDTEEKQKPPVEEPEEAVPDVNELMLRDPVTPGKCCFCRSSAGVHVQCRRVNCAQFFHVMCAHEGKGHVELRTGPILQFHAYCERHRDCTEDIGDLLAKLITRPIRLLVGRDDMRRFGTVAKHLPEYTSAATILRDLAALMVGYCNKGLRASKSVPPDYNVKHLQVLQLFLNHVEQLEKVYALPPTPAQDFVNDKKLFRRIQRTFNPSRYLAKYPGPFSQQHTCDVCLDPFHERQHLFYCSGCEDESGTLHVQHWRCTKRRSNARERERYLAVAGNNGAKKKRNAISIVQNGVRKDITLPKGLPSMTDDIICGICRAPVDARGLIASRKEAKRLDFEKKESKFVQNGCYINSGGAKGYSSYSYGTGSSASSRKPPRPTDGKINGLAGQHAAAQQALGPPKMDRINVQRTTRWLACVAQIIRQTGVPASKAAASTATVSVANGAATTTSLDAKTASAINATTTPTAPDVAAGNSTTAISFKSESNGVSQAEPDAEMTLTPTSSTRSSKINDSSLVTPAMQALFDEAMRLVRPYDSYALSKLETAHDMLLHRSGPGVAVLRMLTHEYTRFMYIKHTRAVEKARNEKRKRAEHEAQEHREKERKRMNLEAERALKKQMLAMRNKQRQHLKATSSK